MVFAMELKVFEEAFLDGIGTCRATCACGKIYWNSDEPWRLDDGEPEELEDNPDAIRCEHDLSYLTMEGVEYVSDCQCWHERAEKIMAFLDAHAHKIVRYFQKEKDRKQAEAGAAPVVDDIKILNIS